MPEDKNEKKFCFSSNFKKTVSGHYYVDKSLLIKDLVDGQVEVSLITRPRRFGKSLNMDMFKTFFEKTDEDTSVYFRNLKIWECGEKYTSQQGKYPVVYLDFKEAKFATYKKTIERIGGILAVEFERHDELKASPYVKEGDLSLYSKIVARKASDVNLTEALVLLTRMLYAHHKIAPIVFIDEYDVPIQSGYDNGYLSDMVKFMRNFLSAGLKNNSNLNFAVLTGVTRISQASIFTGLNNLRVYSVTDDKYSQYYGFTEDEVKAMLRDFNGSDKFDDVCDWYDGYRFGNAEIFNPWSVESYIDNDFKPGTYWSNTTSFGELKIVLDNISEEEADNLELLASGKKIKAKIYDNIPYDKLWEGENVYSMLLVSGYLTKCEASEEERKKLKKDEQWLVIPNKEITDVFCSEILGYANSKYEKAGEYSKKLLTAMEAADAKGVQSVLNDFMKKRKMSVRNKKEGFYHGMVFGLLGNIGGNYDMMSDRESGDGFADITVETFGYGLGARDRSLPCFVLEFKYCGKLDKAKTGRMTAAEYRETKKRLMTESAEDALGQIEKRDYARDLAETHSCIFKYGISFYDKEALAILVENIDGKDIRKVTAEGEIPLE